jgi:hypothetical protein
VKGRIYKKKKGLKDCPKIELMKVSFQGGYFSELMVIWKESDEKKIRREKEGKWNQEGVKM